MLGLVSPPPSSRDPKPDDAPILSGVVANRYRIERQIGEGGMAQVFLATDITRNVMVAVKAPKPELVMQLGAERFGQEVQITTKLQHPLIVPVLDSGFAADGVPFYVMPYIEGESLEQRLMRTGALPIEEAINIASDVLDGLIYAHNLGFVHRDVKPANVMLTGGHALLADFGIARAVERTDNRRLTESGFALGTAEYMSPEQAAGDTQLDGRSDIYSLACVLYEMLVGGPPFTAPTARGVMARHFVDPVPSIRTVRDTVPEKLETAVMTALAKTPVDRFADAAAFKAALKDPTLRDVTAAVRPPLTPASRRNRFLGVGVTVVALAGAAMFWRARSADAATLDPNRVMVYPFVLPEGFTGPKSAGEDVATIIGNALDAADPLKWIDGWSLLDPAARENVRTLTHESARGIARSKRCAKFLTGRLVSDRDSVRVFLTLHDTQGDSVLAQGEAAGVASDPWRQGLSAVSAILPRLIPGGVTDVSGEWKNRPPGAIANFLLGESEFRRVHMREALEHYRKAIGLDSTFATAALRGAQAASWNHRSVEAAGMVRIALAQPLAPRYRDFALGVQNYLAGHADTAIAHLRAATAADADMAVAWQQLGEVYVHLLPLRGNTDSLADAAFATARHLDTAAVSLLLHPIEIRLRRADLTGAAPLLARFRAEHPDSQHIAQLDVEEACVRTNADTAQIRRDVITRAADAVLAAAQLGGVGAESRCGQRLFAMLLQLDTGATVAADGRRGAATLGLIGSHLARGDTARARTALDATLKRWNFGESYVLLAAPLVPGWTSRAREIAARDSIAHGVNYAALPYERRLWELGVFLAQSGRVDVAAGVAAELHRRADTTHARYEASLAQSMDGFVRLAKGDSTGAIDAFTAVIVDGAPAEEVQWDEAWPHAADRLALAELLMARRQYQQAMDIADVFDSPKLVHLVYLRQSLELRVRAAKALGNSLAEQHYLSRLAALRRETQANGV